MYDFGKRKILKIDLMQLSLQKIKLDMYFSRHLIEKFFECVSPRFWQDMLNEQDTLMFIYSSLHDFTNH